MRESGEALARAEATLAATNEKLAFLDEARKQLTEQMKLIAAEVIETTGKKLTEEQQSKIGALLAPMKERFESFSAKLEATDVKRAEEQGRLGQQLEHLMRTSAELDKGARELSASLKGDNKVAGDWGELVLERVLENAGLTEGREYMTQQSETDDDGNRLRPDVVVLLPESKQLVIDAKVSLKPWSEYAAEPDDARWAAVVASTRAHYSALAKKGYERLYGLTSVDFVLLFVPTEPAFLELVRREPELMQDAWRKKVMIVGPSNLQWALRMVASLWRFEDQSRNAQEIAKAAGDLYDKFVGFVEDLEKVGKSLNGAVSAYEGARKKLDTGRSPLLRRAQSLRDLGVAPKKQLPESLLAAHYADGAALLSDAE